MKCPYCSSTSIAVTNSRSTGHGWQVWRRRKCLTCFETFTTHEIVDTSHIFVLKKNGKGERFNRMKLYSGIFYASQSSHILNRELFVDKITREVETKLITLKKKKITSEEIARMVLLVLSKKHIPTFMKFLINTKDIISKKRLISEIDIYSG